MFRGLIFILCFYEILSMYFVLYSEQKCFHIEQPRDSPIVIGYEILDSGHSIGFEMFYSSDFDEDKKIVMTKTFDDAVGHIDFTTDNSGIYTFCMRQLHSDDGSTRFKLGVTYGYDQEYYEKLAKDEKFDTVNTETHRINDLLMMTINEADYQKHKEVKYHKETERMNNAVLWWPMMQIGILVIIGIFQVQYLKSFFKSNKLI